MNKKIDPLQKAKNYAFLLLKFRPRSEKEIYQRLKKKKFAEKIIQEALIFLKDKDFINDTSFARAWIDSRLKKPLGLRRIKEELKRKGVDQEIINSRIEEIKDNYSEEDIVTKIAKERIGRLKGLDPGKIRNRIWGYLIRRGFSPDIVFEAIHQLCKQTS